MVSHLQAKGDAKELLGKKAKLEEKKKQFQRDEETTRETLEKKVRTVGNIVDKSVPISKNEVLKPKISLITAGRQCAYSRDGIPMEHLL